MNERERELAVIRSVYGIPTEKLTDGEISELLAFIDAPPPRELADGEYRADGETSRAYRERTAKDESERAKVARYFELADAVTAITDRALGIERDEKIAYGESPEDEAGYVPFREEVSGWR